MYDVGICYSINLVLFAPMHKEVYFYISLWHICIFLLSGQMSISQTSDFYCFYTSAIIGKSKVVLLLTLDLGLFIYLDIKLIF